MATHPRFSLRQQASVRDHIDAVRLVNFLQDHATKARKNRVDPSRVTAAVALLKKILPDMQQTAVTDPDGGPLTVQVRLPDWLEALARARSSAAR